MSTQQRCNNSSSNTASLLIMRHDSPPMIFSRRRKPVVKVCLHSEPSESNPQNTHWNASWAIQSFSILLLRSFFFHLPSLCSFQRPDISRALSISGDHDPFPGSHPADYVIHPSDDGDFWKTHDCILKVLCFLQCLSGHTKNTFTSAYCQLFFFFFPYTNFSHLPHQPTNGGSLIQESRDDVLPPVIPVFSSLGKKTSLETRRKTKMLPFPQPCVVLPRWSPETVNLLGLCPVHSPT